MSIETYSGHALRGLEGRKIPPTSTKELNDLWALYSNDFIFNRDRFSIEVNDDEVLHTEKRLCVDKEGFFSCADDVLVIEECTWDRSPVDINTIEVVDRYLLAFTACRRTTMIEFMGIDVKKLPYHPTPYDTVYEIPVFCYQDIANKYPDKAGIIDSLLRTLLHSKNDAFTFLRLYNPSGAELDNATKSGLESAGFEFFDYDKQDKILTYIHAPVVNSKRSN